MDSLPLTASAAALSVASVTAAYRRSIIRSVFQPPSAITVISRNLSPRGFSKPFPHPEGRPLFSAYGILTTLRKSFSA